MNNLKPNRRTAIQALLTISAVGALSACKQRESQSGSNKTSLKFAADGKFLTADETLFLSALAKTIIPKTDTASALEAGVPQTIQDLVSNWGDDNLRLYWREGLRKISNELRQRSGQEFEKMPDLQQQNVLSQYDAFIISNKVDGNFYLDLKATVATAYYMSEAGATEELHYDPVPGDWKGDVPFSEIGKAWAT